MLRNIRQLEVALNPSKLAPITLFWSAPFDSFFSLISFTMSSNATFDQAYNNSSDQRQWQLIKFGTIIRSILGNFGKISANVETGNLSAYIEMIFLIQLEEQ